MTYLEEARHTAAIQETYAKIELRNRHLELVARKEEAAEAHAVAVAQTKAAPDGRALSPLDPSDDRRSRKTGDEQSRACASGS